MQSVLLARQHGAQGGRSAAQGLGTGETPSGMLTALSSAPFAPVGGSSM
jgi:hypothetical protein